MSEEQKKRRGRPPGSGKKKLADAPAQSDESLSFEPVSPAVSSSGSQEIDYGYHFIDSDEDYGDKFKIALESAVSARKNQSVSYRRMSEVQDSFAFPFKHFLLQAAVGQYGIPPKKIIDIIGAEGIGKTTLIMQMLGWAMDVGCPALYIECEAKQMQPSRVMRSLHTNIGRAYKMLNRLRVEPVNSLDHMWQVMKDYVYIARGTKGNKDTPRVPMHVPIVIAIDPWSKLLNPDEAKGFYNYGDNMSDANKKKFKEINEGSNLGHAKWAHKWCRLLPSFLQQYNVVLLIVHHQNAKIDMAGGGAASYMSAEASALYNKTRIGGQALHQNTALTLILSRRGLSKNTAGEIVGNLISCRIAKNSYGPDNTKFFYEVKTGPYNDTFTHMDPAINFNIGFATMCAEQKWMSTSVKGTKFSSPVLGVQDVTADEFYAAFEADPDARVNLGSALGINGYVDFVDKIRDTIDKNYHTEYDESIESDSEPAAVQLTETELQELRDRMEQGFTAPQIDESQTDHLQSVISQIDSSQLESTNEAFISED